MSKEAQRELLYFDSFAIAEINDKGQMVGVDEKGERREFSLVVHVERETRTPQIGVARHFVDPESAPAFENTQPWKNREPIVK